MKVSGYCICVPVPSHEGERLLYMCGIFLSIFILLTYNDMNDIFIKLGMISGNVNLYTMSEDFAWQGVNNDDIYRNSCEF